MLRQIMNEDKSPSKLLVVFSPKLSKEIDTIYGLNQKKIVKLFQWYSYIDEITNYISNRAIAWNYNGRNMVFPNGTFFVKDFEYNVGYTIKTDKKHQYSYVYVFMMNLKPEEFDLKIPPILQERKQTNTFTNKVYPITESQLRQIIREAIRKIIA